MLDFLSACSARGVLKILQFSAALVLAANHERPAAGVAFLATHKGGAATERAGGSERPAASGAYRVTALNLLKAGRAVIAKGRTTATRTAETAVPLNHLTTVYAWLLVGGHRLTLLLVVLRMHRRTVSLPQVLHRKKHNTGGLPLPAACRTPGRS